ncbi:hemerythrin domain-containing protein [Streptomyces sp. NPDC014744]|uniref:hemerythrin domain-containing protein n=1 Tax=Streptomyces sp. NPDC014744 TaxID=3364903 RepID=UPI0036FFC074
MGHGGNVIDELTTDHREVEALFERIEALPVGDPGRRALADEMTTELVRHSVAEEQYFYPAVRQYVAGGDELADKELSDHAKVEELLKSLEDRQPEEEEFNHLVAKVKLEVTSHVRDEEGKLFPLLAAVCTSDALDDLGDKIRRAKKTAPTRPHPSAPTTPPANKLLAPGAGLVDRARDLLARRSRGH